MIRVAIAVALAYGFDVLEELVGIPEVVFSAAKISFGMNCVRLARGVTIVLTAAGPQASLV